MLTPSAEPHGAQLTYFSFITTGHAPSSSANPSGIWMGIPSAIHLGAADWQTG